MKTIDPPWADDIVVGLDSILRSKLGENNHIYYIRSNEELADISNIICVFLDK